MPAGKLTTHNLSLDLVALDGAVRRVGDRWSLRVVGALLDGERTFGELSTAVDGIAPNILANRLKALQSDGLVVATPYERRPLRMRYALSEAGGRLASAIATLAEWGARREGRRPGAHHGACGTPLETRSWCPTCEQPVDHGAATSLIWA